MDLCFYRCKSEGVDIQTIDTIDIEQEVDTPKPVKKRGRRPKIKEETSIDGPVSNTETVQNDNYIKENDKQDMNTSVQNLIEMLEEDDKDNNEETTNDIEEDCTQKLIQPSDIKQEAIHPDLENMENIENIENIDNMDEDVDEDDIEGSTILDDDDSDYEGNNESKNGGESSSPKKPKITKNSVKKKAPEILIPQMVR